MCCFSKKVQSVSATKIFARDSRGDRQYLVYEMQLRAKEQLAMILPIPVPENSQEKAVTFINLKGYTRFFVDLSLGFPKGRGAAGGMGFGGHGGAAKKTLEVVEVGDFEASFVPKVADFERLDERFRLPAETWNELPAYKNYGFAVFKLKPGGTRHPMAFEFPRAKPEELFFPTVHIHDGMVHAEAGYDHKLYCQTGEGDYEALTHWTESESPARRFMDIRRTKGIVDGDEHCYVRDIRGRHKNEDVVLA